MKAERNTRRLSLSLAAGMLMTLIVPAAASLAAAEPKIAFLNPSSFALAGERGYIVSDAETDTGPGCCDASDGVYRFSAWVADAPAEASVFFTVVQGAFDFELPAVEPAGDDPASDTWEASWDIPPEVLNGPATVTAYVVLDNEPIAQKSVDVTIMRIEPAVDLAYPVSGGGFGIFTPLASALPEKGAAARKKPLAARQPVDPRGPHGGAEAEALRPYVGKWVAQKGIEVVVAADTPEEVFDWLYRHNVRADGMFRVPERAEDVTGAAPF